MAKPTDPTWKRLFAVSGNRCAYRGCPQPLIDETTGAVVGEVCHIRGDKKGAKRFDESQSDKDRHGYDNLILMCGTHHTVIDSDEAIFTPEVLLALKAEHEARWKGDPQPDDLCERFAANVTITTQGGSVVAPINPTGGQFGHSITNNHYGPAADRPSAFRLELERRHLANATDPEFARTTHQKKLGPQDRSGNPVPLPTAAVLFAHSAGLGPTRPAEDGAFLAWMDCNKWRYEPCEADFFIPGLIPERAGSAFVWHDGGVNGFGIPARRYFNYIAADRTGFVEYGFNPGSNATDVPGVYYARVVARTVGFLSLIRDLASQRAIDPVDVSFGLAIRGTKGVELGCIVQQAPLMRFGVTSERPAADNLLHTRHADGSAWDTDEAAIGVAEALFDHWTVSCPEHFGIPEFTDGRYTGQFFRNKFGGW
jgi:hypothetical protein